MTALLPIPAIDLKDGRCVRLKQGRMEDATIYGDDPVAMAGRWVEQGAQRLHLVDLDGAIDGEPRNRAVIEAITQQYPALEIQVGGGIRDAATVAGYFSAGVRFAVIGTRAVQDPGFVRELSMENPGRIIVALDAQDGQVATHGWASVSGTSAVELGQQFADAGIAAILYTDIGRDGMLTGVNVEATAELARETGLPVLASGGVASLDDLRALWAVRDSGISGAILGRALYENRFSLSEAIGLLNDMEAAA